MSYKLNYVTAITGGSILGGITSIIAHKIYNILYRTSSKFTVSSDVRLNLVHLKNIHDVSEDQAKPMGAKLSEETKERSIKTQFMIQKYIARIDPYGDKFPIVLESLPFDHKTLTDDKPKRCQGLDQLKKLPNSYEYLSQIEKDTLYFNTGFFYHLCTSKVNRLYPSMDSNFVPELDKLVKTYVTVSTLYHQAKTPQEKIEISNQYKELEHEILYKREEQALEFCKLAAHNYYHNKQEEIHTVLLQYGIAHKFSSVCKYEDCKLTEVFFIMQQNPNYNWINTQLSSAKSGVNKVDLGSGMFAIEYQEHNLAADGSDIVGAIRSIFTDNDLWGY